MARPLSPGFHFQNTYSGLPEAFYVRTRPIPVKGARTVLFNEALSTELGLNTEALAVHGTAIFAGNEVPEGADPLAMAYAGHQFGHLNMLGDGRAVLLGEHVMPDGRRVDVQLKGSGQTVFSRSGDGRAALGPMIREYIVSEAMHNLGVPTTRSLAVVATGEPVFRDRALPGAVLVRIASSHIRVGTFEYALYYGHANQMPDLVKRLADYTIARHYPELVGSKDPYPDFLEQLADRQARLVARWMNLGFIHGVMNTDNVSVSGETIDYGPCAFLDDFSFNKVFSSIDRNGRYAFQNQPPIAGWNLARLADCLLGIVDADPKRATEVAEARLSLFSDRFRHHWLAGLRAKLGLFTEEEGDEALGGSLFAWMQSTGADFTLTFRRLSADLAAERAHPSFAEWHRRWQERLARQPQSQEEVKTRMESANPARIPRNHCIEEVIRAAEENDDYRPLHRLLAACARPYEARPEFQEYESPPKPEERVPATFCGT